MQVLVLVREMVYPLQRLPALTQQFLVVGEN